jgi:hypothetical protein
VDHLLGVGADEFLHVGGSWLRKLVGQPEDVGGGVSLLLDRLAGPLEFFPHGDDHERQEDGVDHAQSRVDEAGHVVVLLARVCGHETLDQLEARKREEAYPSDHQDAIDYGV